MIVGPATHPGRSTIDREDRAPRAVSATRGTSSRPPAAATMQIACLRHMLVDMTAKPRVLNGQCPVRRPVFLRTHGIIVGEITFDAGIPEDLRHGLFANPGATQPVCMRYPSNAPRGCASCRPRTRRRSK